MSISVLTAAYALHLGATVVWIGGLLFLAGLLPALLARLPEEQRQALLASAQARFQPFAWLCLAVFVGTGLTQMAASPKYEGVLAVGSTWSAAILAKHLVIGGMVAILVYQTWGLQPRLERYRLGLEKPGAPALAGLRRRGQLLLRASLALGLAVLMLTALARANA